MPLIVPTEIRAARFKKINRLLADYREHEVPEKLAKAVKAMVEDPEFSDHIKATPDLQKPVQTIDQLQKFAWNYLYHFLYKRDYVAAALILWGPAVFTPEPECAQDIWNSLFMERMIGIIGCGGVGKSYTPSAWLLLDWILDPEWTRIQVASNSEDHLLKNVFADIVRLHTEASLPLPGKVDGESISLDKKRGMGIFTITLPGGPLSKGKIKGAHTKPRPLHPLFGRRSRIRMLVDEAQEVPGNIFTEIPNRFSTARKGDVEHIKFIVCANPKDIFSEFGRALKPECGYDRLPMSQRTWRSEEGWFVVSINAMDQENVKQKRMVYPGIITFEGVQVWIQRCHGDMDHPDMWTYVYGRFPPAGRMVTIIKQEWLTRSEGEWIFDSTTENFASKDPAHTGDNPEMAYGRSGRAVAWRRTDGTIEKLKAPKMALQVDAVGIMPRGDTQEAADSSMERLKELSVKPPCFAIDRTGLGQGEHDIIRVQWKDKVGPLGDDSDPQGKASIYGIHYGEAASEIKVSEEDTELPKDLYDGIASELWYAGSKLIEYDVVRFGRGITGKCYEQLSARQGSMKVGKGKKQTVEGKKDYKKRTGNGSPDEADTILMLLQVMRRRTSNLMPKAKDTVVEEAPPEDRWGKLDMEVREFTGSDIHGLPAIQEMSQAD